MKNKSLFIADDGTNYAFPFVLISCLFLLWGFAHALLDVLNKHFQDSLELTKAQSGMGQASAYGAYFLMGLPAGFIARRYGYRTGVLVGLSFFALGCFWFVPAVSINTFASFLFDGTPGGLHRPTLRLPHGGAGRTFVFCPRLFLVCARGFHQHFRRFPFRIAHHFFRTHLS